MVIHHLVCPYLKRICHAEITGILPTGLLRTVIDADAKMEAHK
jgi:hypothetical protein